MMFDLGHILREALLARPIQRGKPKYTCETIGEVIHRHGNGRVVRTPLKRASLIDRSRYSGAQLRAIRAARGCGRPLPR